MLQLSQLPFKQMHILIVKYRTITYFKGRVATLFTTAYQWVYICYSCVYPSILQVDSFRLITQINFTLWFIKQLCLLCCDSVIS